MRCGGGCLRGLAECLAGLCSCAPCYKRLGEDPDERVDRAKPKTNQTPSAKSSLTSHYAPSHLYNSEVPFINLMRDGGALSSADGGESEEAAGDSAYSSPVRSRASTFDHTIDVSEINPAVYKDYDPDDDYIRPAIHSGRLWYSVSYDSEEELLSLQLIKCRNLSVVRDYLSPGDAECFVRASLYPNERRYIQTRRESLHTHLTFRSDIIYKLPLPAYSFEEGQLKFSLHVTNPNVDSKLDFRLTAHALATISDDSERQWVDLLPKASPLRSLLPKVADYTNSCGMISVSLTYCTGRQKLIITIYKLSHRDNKALPEPAAGADVQLKVDFYVESRRARKLKTAFTKQFDGVVTFNESFKCSVLESKLNTMSVVIRATAKQAHKGYGRVVLGGPMLATGKELDHWQSMMERPDKEHKLWQHLQPLS